MAPPEGDPGVTKAEVTAYFRRMGSPRHSCRHGSSQPPLFLPMDYLTTANVLLWVFLTVAFYFVFLSHWLVAASLFPDYVAKCQAQYGRPLVTTLVGLLFTVVPISVGLVIANVAPTALDRKSVV